jgi:hypothetical protein
MIQAVMDKNYRLVEELYHDLSNVSLSLVFQYACSLCDFTSIQIFVNSGYLVTWESLFCVFYSSGGCASEKKNTLRFLMDQMTLINLLDVFKMEPMLSWHDDILKYFLNLPQLNTLECLPLFKKQGSSRRFCWCQHTHKRAVGTFPMLVKCQKKVMRLIGLPSDDSTLAPELIWTIFEYLCPFCFMADHSQSIIKVDQ